MNDEQGGFAVITGASSGIGLELAKVFAENGYDLMLNAEDEELESAAAEVRSNGASVETVRADLTQESGVRQLYDAIQSSGRPLDVLVLNAGVGAGGNFALDTPLERALEIVDLNVRSVVHLTKLLLPQMLERNEGRVLITSSVASTMPGSYQAVYNASKSFVQSFGLALQYENKDSDVTLTLLMPGPTETEFFERAGLEDTKIGGAADKDDAAQVARQGYEATMNGDERVVGGSVKNKVQVAASRVMPDKAKAAMHGRMAEPGSAEDDDRD